MLSAFVVFAACFGGPPILLVGIWRGWDHTLFKEGVFFSKAAMVTFGGAYAVLPYVAQQAVEQYGWLKPGQMTDGLGLAETTPGPLIIVLQFVGFMGAWHNPGGLPPIVAGTLGAFITTWATFVPCFLWIFLGAPHIEQLRGNVKLTTALSDRSCGRRRIEPGSLVRDSCSLPRRENARLVRTRAERRFFHRYAQMEMGGYSG
jgi:Chromate transporter